MTAAADLRRLRVDNVGSMLRPPGLLEAMERHRAGELGDEGLRRAQDEAIAALIARQVEIGMPVIVDGELRRTQFMASFAEVAGFEGWIEGQERARARRGLREEHGRVQAPSALAAARATERLALRRNRPLEDYRFAAALTRRPVKPTLIGPERIVSGYDEAGSRDVYADADAFARDVVAVERRIVSELLAAGCRYVHIDAPGFTRYADPATLERLRGRGVDPRELMAAMIAAENEVIAGHEGAVFAIHLCRGNERGHWHREGSYEEIAEQLFSQLRHDRLLLEYDSPRAGGFEALRFVRPGAVAVLGLITTKSPVLERRDTLLARIEEASRHLPIEQLAISPQCGFASTFEGNPLTEEEQWRKLELMLEVAEEVWGGSTAVEKPTGGGDGS